MHNQDNDQNNNTCLWGVELDSDYNSSDVRDAMLKCFINANGKAIAKTTSMELPKNKEEKEKIIKQMTTAFVQRAFTETSGDYNSPNKESILAALDKLKEYAASQNHSAEMIEQHAAEIKKLTEGLKE